jgi:hypothetical protein
MFRVFLAVLIASIVQVACPFMHQVGYYTGNVRAFSIAVDDGRAYLLDGNGGMLTLSVGNPAYPSCYSEWSQTYFQHVAARDTLVFVQDYGDGVYLVNVADPRNPYLFSRCQWLIPQYNFRLDGDRVYIAGMDQGMRIFDVSDPLNPLMVGEYNPGIRVDWVETDGNLAYIADFDFGLRILDVSNPDSINQVSELALNHAARICMAGNYALVLYNGSYLCSGLRMAVIDCSDPTAPAYVTAIDCQTEFEGLCFHAPYIFVVDNLQGLLTFDLTNPAQPEEVGVWNVDLCAWDVALDGDYAYVCCDYYGLVILDVSDLSACQVVGSLDTPGYTLGVKVSGDYAYLPCYDGGLSIANLSDPTTPVMAHHFNSNNLMDDVDVSGTIAIAANGTSGIKIYDVSNPPQAHQIATLELPDFTRSVQIVDTLLYVIAFEGDFSIVSIADPSHPSLISTQMYSNSGFDVLVDGHIAFLSDDGMTLRIVDVTDPLHPVQISHYDGLISGEYLCKQGDYLYISDFNLGEVILDVSDPTTPTLASIIRPHQYSQICCSQVFGNRLYIADYNLAEIGIYSLDDPGHPALEKMYYWDRRTEGFAMYGDYLVTANGYMGLSLLDPATIPVEDASAPAITTRPTLAIRPNPFNPQTTLAYSLPEPGLVRIEIYNLRGERVRALIDERQTAGEHSVEWSGDDDRGAPAASGVYLARVRCGSDSVVRRCLLLK